ncbi:hypothetical protein ACOKSZ_05545 [Propionibacteriaceae bacterium Y1685]
MMNMAGGGPWLSTTLAPVRSSIAHEEESSRLLNDHDDGLHCADTRLLATESSGTIEA